MAEIGADDGNSASSGPVVSEGQIAGAGTQIEDRSVARVRYNPRGPPPPIAIDVETKQVIQKIITRRDVAEHRANSRLALVEEQCRHFSFQFSVFRKTVLSPVYTEN